MVYLLFRPVFPGQYPVIVIRLVQTLLRPDERELDILLQKHLERLPVSLVHAEQEKRDHHQDHDERSQRYISRLLHKKKERQSDQDRRPEAQCLPPRQVEKHFFLHAGEIPRNRYICCHLFSSPSLMSIKNTL